MQTAASLCCHGKRAIAFAAMNLNVSYVRLRVNREVEPIAFYGQHGDGQDSLNRDKN
jgi:hypothetical protein